MKLLRVVPGVLLICFSLGLATTAVVANQSPPAKPTNSHNHYECSTLSPISSDGRQILFASDRDGDAEIFIMNTDGSQQRQLTHNEDWDSQPVWSADGREIYFVSDRDGSIAFYALTDGAGLIKLEEDPYHQIEDPLTQIELMSQLYGNYQFNELDSPDHEDGAVLTLPVTPVENWAELEPYLERISTNLHVGPLKP